MKFFLVLERVFQPAHAKKLPQASINACSSRRRVASFSGRICPPHPPRPLNEMLQRAARNAASYRRVSSSRFNPEFSPSLRVVRVNLDLKPVREQLVSSSKNSWLSESI